MTCCLETSYFPSKSFNFACLSSTFNFCVLGANADVVFGFLNEPPNNKFRIEPKSGAVTATSSLAMESGKMYHLEVVATDRGNPPQSSNCLIEITVGEIPDHVPTLRFQNLSYTVQLHENSPSGTEVVQVNIFIRFY